MNHPLAKLILCSCLLWLAAGAFWYATAPTFRQLTVQPDSGAARTFEAPVLSFTVPSGHAVVTQIFDLPAVHATRFVVYGLDTLNSLKVNDREVTCSPPPAFGRACDLSSYLHRGTNRVEATVSTGKSVSPPFFFMAPSVGDGCRLVLLVLCALAAVPTLNVCLYAAGIRLDWLEWLIVYAAALLRLVYFAGTPFYVRALDYGGHIDYIEHFTHHVKLPQIGFEWESYQPPLYYAILGFPSRLFEHFGVSREHLWSLWQFPSLLMSCATMAACVWIARLLYPDPPRKFLRAGFLTMMGWLPTLVYNASRINNDVLEALVAFVWLALLLKFWREPRKLLWLAISVVAAFSILTKSNGLILMAVSLVALAMHPGLSIKTKLGWAAVLAGSFVVLDGWYEALRYWQSSGVVNSLVANVGNLPQLEKMTQSQSIAKSLTFNPWEVVAYPDVDRMGVRRDMAPEYFFKSAFITAGNVFRVHLFAPRVVLVSVLVLLPLLVYGLIRSKLSRASIDVPLLMVLGVLLAAHWAFLRMVPYASSQDFRYSTLLLVPLAYFLLGGISHLPAALRPVGWALLFLALAISGAYLLGLSLTLC